MHFVARYQFNVSEINSGYVDSSGIKIVYFTDYIVKFLV